MPRRTAPLNENQESEKDKAAREFLERGPMTEEDAAHLEYVYRQRAYNGKKLDELIEGLADMRAKNPEWYDVSELAVLHNQIKALNNIWREVKKWHGYSARGKKVAEMYSKTIREQLALGVPITRIAKNLKIKRQTIYYWQEREMGFKRGELPAIRRQEKKMNERIKTEMKDQFKSEQEARFSIEMKDMIAEQKENEIQKLMLGIISGGQSDPKEARKQAEQVWEQVQKKLDQDGILEMMGQKPDASELLGSILELIGHKPPTQGSQ